MARFLACDVMSVAAQVTDVDMLSEPSVGINTVVEMNEEMAVSKCLSKCFFEEVCRSERHSLKAQ
jgi:hypothetical protein